MKFSVITPSFRQLDWLRLCIASVRDQVDSSLPVSVEHIVQDGGSSGISDLARELGADYFEDGRLIAPGGMSDSSYSLTVHSEKDRGMYDAINRGLRRSHGDICSWLNCDEQYLPGALGLVGSAFQSHAAWEMLVGDTILLNENLEPRSYRPGVPPSREYIQEFQLNLHSSSLFFSRSILDRDLWLGDRFRSVGDAEWIARVLDTGIAIHRLAKPLSTFVLGVANLSGNEMSSREKDVWRSEKRLSPLKAHAVKLRYTAKRITAGAFLPRRAGISIFTPADVQSRKTFPASWLDFRFRV